MKRTIQTLILAASLAAAACTGQTAVQPAALVASGEGTAAATATANTPAAPDKPALTCGAPTKAGHPCKRRVKVPGSCWMHKGATPATPAK